MEMASKRKNLNPHANNSSQPYFLFWIYNHIRKEEDVNIEHLYQEKKIMTKKKYHSYSLLYTIKTKSSSLND